MKSLTPQNLKTLTFTGLFCLSVPLSISGLWILAFNSGVNQTERVEIFRSYFPGFMQGRFDLTILILAFCFLAFTSGLMGIKSPGKIWKSMNIFILVFSIVLAILNLFQLM